MFQQSKPASSGLLDLVFLHDATQSQQPFIDGTYRELDSVSSALSAAGNVAPDSLRVGLVAFRDHPPQESTFITKVYPLTSKIASIKASLANLVASGGGDEPDAQSDALADALAMGWRDRATKVVFLFTDSPPHGIGEPGDEFPDGSPSKVEPLEIAQAMANKGIVLYVVGSEPILSEQCERAHDFYKALTSLTGGKLVPLTDVLSIPEVIVGCVSDAVSLGGKGGNLSARGSLMVDFYEQSEQGMMNVGIWSKADKLSEAKNMIKAVKGHRIVKKYREM